MAEELRAIPDILCYAGNELAEHGDSLLVLQQSCRREAENAQPGWVGSSAAALSGLLDRWAIASTNHIGRFSEHAGGMYVAATGFTASEQRNATALAQVNDTVDGEI
ncbi:hypothetical protein MHAE_06172 [Mycobacterium haemophilum DSM 44634]|uniref:hypothetical protein n=1 Tax=Mycobacterium haemophilum TaxID=29311 RepID=UPI0006D5C50F|nr:hypothetical protein [Mycobacterium haemophilum]